MPLPFYGRNTSHAIQGFINLAVGPFPKMRNKPVEIYLSFYVFFFKVLKTKEFELCMVMHF